MFVAQSREQNGNKYQPDHIDSLYMKIPEPRPVLKGPENEKKKIADGSPEHRVKGFQLLSSED